MASDEDRAAATALKDKGNAAFKGHDWPGAIDFYSQAIEKYDSDPVFYSNRAQAQIKLEAYGYGVADASKAIELDPNFVKVRNPSMNDPVTALLTTRRHIGDEPPHTPPSLITKKPSAISEPW